MNFLSFRFISIHFEHLFRLRIHLLGSFSSFIYNLIIFAVPIYGSFNRIEGTYLPSFCNSFTLSFSQMLPQRGMRRVPLKGNVH